MRTILIVDSEREEVALLESMLGSEGYEFVTAADAAEAKSIVRQQGAEIRAVLLDWLLPDGKGMELLVWLQAQPELAEVEVVVESAEFVRENVRAAIDAGAYYFLTKPFDEPRVEAIVRAAVEACETRHRLVEKVEETQGAFRLLQTGRFHVRTIREAELLAIHISSACDRPEASVGLLELLVNAVEHGNLEITYEEKGRLLIEQRLGEERRRRLLSPAFRDRRVRVDLERTSDGLQVMIADEGPGFDFEKYLILDRERLFHTHGRGVLLASSTLDLAYTPPGNQVTVSIPS